MVIEKLLFCFRYMPILIEGLTMLCTNVEGLFLFVNNANKVFFLPFHNMLSAKHTNIPTSLLLMLHVNTP